MQLINTMALLQARSWNTSPLLIAEREGRADGCENLEKRRKVTAPSGERRFCMLVSLCVNWLFVHTQMPVKWCMLKRCHVSHSFMGSNAFVMGGMNFEAKSTMWMWSPMHYPRIKREETTVCTIQMVDTIGSKHKMCVFIWGIGMEEYYGSGKWMIRNNLDQFYRKKRLLFSFPCGQKKNIIGGECSLVSP